MYRYTFWEFYGEKSNDSINEDNINELEDNGSDFTMLEDAANHLYGWKKKSIFFTLRYWRKLKIHHNLDVTHIEKNV